MILSERGKGQNTIPRKSRNNRSLPHQSIEIGSLIGGELPCRVAEVDINCDETGGENYGLVYS
jgi:hypothetical protein